MKNLALVFSGNDTNAAKQFAVTLRNNETNAMVVDAYSFNRNENPGHAYIMPDVPRWHADRIIAAYPQNTLIEIKKERVIEIAAEIRTLVAEIVPQKRRRGRPPRQVKA